MYNLSVGIFASFFETKDVQGTCTCNISLMYTCTCKFNVYMYIILSTIKWICKHVYNFNKNMKNAWYTVLIINCKKNIHIYIYLFVYTIYNNKFTTKLYFCYSWSCLLSISLFPTNISSLLLLSIFFWSLSNQFYNKIVIVIFDWTIFFLN